MIRELIELALTVYIGGTAHYGPGVMERVARIRRLPVVEHMCSSPFYRDEYLGDWIRVESLLTGEVIDCRITDVSQDEHRQGQIDGGRWLEVGWPTAQQICLNVYVADKSPAECPTRFWLRRDEDRIKEVLAFHGRNLIEISCTRRSPFFIRQREKC